MQPEVAVIGSGPNGLAAAIALQQAGAEVELFEAEPVTGGAVRTEELTLPGFRQDMGAAIMPLGAGSPFLDTLPLAQFGLEWVQPEAPCAHPLPDGDAVSLERDLGATADALGVDADAYRALLGSLVKNWEEMRHDLLAPIHIPKHPFAMAGFGLKAMQPAASIAKSQFKTERARALFCGLASHGALPLTNAFSSAVALMLAAPAHRVGWPFPRGGAGALATALTAYFTSIGGVVHTGHRVAAFAEVMNKSAVVCDMTPRPFVSFAGDALPEKYRTTLTNYRYGPGSFKVDWALSGPIPWLNRECLRSATVHVGGTMAEMLDSEQAAWDGRTSPTPYVLLTQPSLFDSTRAPAGRHTAWGYCHIPNGSAVDMTDAIEARVEEFAPGFRDCILARRSMGPQQFAKWDTNIVGGDVNGGAFTPSQIFTRPTMSTYRTPVKNLFLCSSATPPGGGVHGMCGFHAAQAVKKHLHLD